MKIRLILCLALGLSGGWWIFFCSNGRLANWIYDQQRQNESAVSRTIPEGIWAKKLKTSWTDSKVILYRASGEVVKFDAKKAVYTVWSIKDPAHKGKEFNVPVAALLDPKTGNVWIGEVDADDIETNEYENEDHTISTNYLTYTNFFIENDSEILQGDSVLTDGAFDCAESRIQKAQSDEGLDSVIERFDKSTNSSWPFNSADLTTTFFHDFRGGFFDSGNLGSQTTQIRHVEITSGKLRLDFNSLKYKTTGSVWLDLNTLKVLKTVEHK